MNSRPRSLPPSHPLDWNHHHRPRSLQPLLHYHPGTLQGSVSVSPTLSHPCLNHRETIVIPSPKYPPTSLLSINNSLPVARFVVLAVAPPPTSAKTARLMSVLGAWSLPLVMPSITAPLHAVVRILLLIATTLLEAMTFRILGSEVVPQMYNGGNVTEYPVVYRVI